MCTVHESNYDTERGKRILASVSLSSLHFFSVTLSTLTPTPTRSLLARYLRQFFFFFFFFLSSFLSCSRRNTYWGIVMRTSCKAFLVIVRPVGARIVCCNTGVKSRKLIMIPLLTAVKEQDFDTDFVILMLVYSRAQSQRENICTNKQTTRVLW